MDSTFSKLITTLSAGTYQAVIKVEGFDPSMPYIPSYIISDPIVIDGIDIDSATSIVDANYIDSGNTIRIVWIPATNSQNRAWATTNYKVYLRGKDNIYTAINSQVKSGKQNGETVYYADYLVSNNTIAYDFYIVLSDNGKVENNNSSPKKVTVNKYGNSLATNVSSVYAYFTSIDADNKINDVYFSCSPSSIPEGVTLTSVKYKIFPKNVNSDTYKYTDKDLLLDSDFASSGVYYVKDLPKDAKIIFQYVLTETGKTDRVCTVSPSGTAQ